MYKKKHALKRLASIVTTLALLILSPLHAETEKVPLHKNEEKALTAHPIVKMNTSKGEIIIKLYPEKAPKSVENFLSYVQDDFYSNTLIHRVVDGFLIQGGGFATGYNEKKTKKPIRNESQTALANKRGTIGFALTTNPHSAASQFYINTTDNPELNVKPSKKYGFTAFGEIIEGMNVIDKIKKEPVSKRLVYSAMYKRKVTLHHTPNEDIIINSIDILRPLQSTSLPSASRTDTGTD